MIGIMIMLIACTLTTITIGVMANSDVENIKKSISELQTEKAKISAMNCDDVKSYILDVIPTYKGSEFSPESYAFEHYQYVCHGIPKQSTVKHVLVHNGTSLRRY